MVGRMRLVLYLIFAVLLAGCTLGGESGTLMSRKATLGIPTTWLINREVYGRVVDFGSCENEKDMEKKILSFYPDTCSPVANAEVTLIIGGYNLEECEFHYATRTDADGRFRFKRHTTIRLVDEHDGNTYESGWALITADGFPPLRARVSWEGEAALTEDRPVLNYDEIRGFATGKIQKTMLLILTPPVPS